VFHMEHKLYTSYTQATNVGMVLAQGECMCAV